MVANKIKNHLHKNIPYDILYVIKITNPCIVRVDWNFRTNAD